MKYSSSVSARDFRSNFSPIQEGGCTARFCLSDTRCSTYVIYAAYLEGRCSIHLSYGRVACIDSKSFIASTSIILNALSLYRKGRRSIPTEPQANGATVVSSCSSTDLFNRSNADSRSIQSNWGFFGWNFKAQTLLTQRGGQFVASVRNQILGKYVSLEIACLVSRSTAPLEIVSSNPATAANSKHSITFTYIGRNMTVANRLKRYQGIANTNVQLFPDGAAGSMGASRLIQIGSRLGRFANVPPLFRS